MRFNFSLQFLVIALLLLMQSLSVYAIDSGVTEAQSQEDKATVASPPSAGKLDAKALEDLTKSTEKTLEEKKKDLGKSDVERQKLLIEKNAMEKQLKIKKEELKLKQERAEAARKEVQKKGGRKATAEAKTLEKEAHQTKREYANMREELEAQQKEAHLAVAESAAKAEEIAALKKELDNLNASRAALFSAEKKTLLFFGVVLGTLLIILFKNVLVKKLDHSLTPAGYSQKGVRRLRYLTLMRIVNWIVSVMLISFSGFLILKLFGFNLTTTLAGAGVLGMVLGFGGQYVIRDMFAGLSIVLEGQYSVNDLIRIGEHQGVVEDVNLRFTRLRNLDGTVVYIQNGEVKTVMNFTKEFSYATVSIYLDYNDDVDKMMELITRIVDELRSEDRYRNIIVGSAGLLGIHGFTRTGMKIKFRVKTQPGEQWQVARELRLRLKKSMDLNGLNFFRFENNSGRLQQQLVDAVD